MLEEEGTEVGIAEAVDSVEVVLVGAMTDSDVTETLAVSDPVVDSVTEVASVACPDETVSLVYLEVTMTEEEAEFVLLAIAVVLALLNPLVVEVARTVVAVSVDRLSVQVLEGDEMSSKSSIAQEPPQVSSESPAQLISHRVLS